MAATTVLDNDGEQQKASFKPLLSSLLPPDAPTGREELNPNKAYRCCDIEERNGLIDSDKFQAYCGNKLSSNDALVFCSFYNMAKQAIESKPKVKLAIEYLRSCVDQHIDEYGKDRRDSNLIIHDCPTTVTLAILGFLSGYTSISAWVETINFSPMFRGTLCAMLPQLYAPPYDYRYECVYRLVSMFAGTYYKDNDAKAKEDGGMEAIHVFFRNLRSEQIKQLEPLTEYSPTHGFLKGQVFKFLTPRFIVLGFDGQELRASFLPEDATSRTGYTSVNLFDCTHRICITNRIRMRKNQESSAFLDMLESLKDLLPMGQVLFVADALNTSPKVIEAVIKSGANYLLIIKRNGVNKAISSLVLRLLNFNQSSPALHTFTCDPYKVSGRIEQVSVQAIKLSRCAKPELSLEEDKLHTNVTRSIEGTYPSVVSLVRYDKDSKEVRGNYSAKGLEDLNACHDQEVDGDNHMLFITNVDVDQDQNFDKILCAINERWLYETAHNIVDENLNQDRLQQSKAEMLAVRVGCNQLTHDFLTHARQAMFDEMKSRPGRGLKKRQAYRPPSYDVVISTLTNPLNFLDCVGNYLCDCLHLDQMANAT